MELNEVCSRCGKSVKIPADPELMKRKIEEEEHCNEVVSKLIEFVATLDDPLPEIVTLQRVQTDEAKGEFVLEVRALTRLCGPDDSKKRNKGGCASRIASLVADIYREATPKEC